ncbi:MAG: hypothetical protein ACD_62C00099G0001, partial [uncultured bacterium]
MDVCLGCLRDCSKTKTVGREMRWENFQPIEIAIKIIFPILAQ